MRELEMDRRGVMKVADKASGVKRPASNLQPSLGSWKDRDDMIGCSHLVGRANQNVREPCRHLRVSI